jgi:hypothetical protein
VKAASPAPGEDTAAAKSSNAADSIATAPLTGPEAAKESPALAAVNRLLRDSGLTGLRLLRAGEVKDGALRDAFLEIRESGFPVGCHQAERLRVAIDPMTRRGELVLNDGVTILRNQRTAFAGGTPLSLAIPLVAPDAWLDRDLVAFLELRPRAGAPPAAPPPPTFDAKPLLAALNRALEADGYEEYQMFHASGVELGGEGQLQLKDVKLHVYQAGGALKSVVSAARCKVTVDRASPKAVLRFEDGKHAAKGREVPFFRGLGDSVGAWTLELTKADPERWTRLLDQWRPAAK